MALTRKALSAMGIEDEKIEQIIEMHTATVNALKDERDQYKSDADRLDGVQKELDAMKADNGDSPYKVKYEAMKEERDALQAEFDQYKADQSAKETTAAKAKAYRDLLKEVGIADKRLDAILRITNVDELDMEDGALKDAEKLKESAKEEWADFIVTTSTQGAQTATPPANHATDGSKTKEEIMAIKDSKERQTEIAKNHELFGF